ncbi:MAG TPA: cupin domain-containing protein [Xanthobacteraceae bacterium]|nr:cupin domain-containing protein [Xanthobacteraceae bacterium]
MEIKRSGSEPSRKGPAEWFTRAVRIDPSFQPPHPARVSGALVTFDPGARTASHSHALGQTLFIVSGLGRVQHDGGPIEEVRPGDVVWFPPSAKLWHGASPASAVQEALDGNNVYWLEQVCDDQYDGRPEQA